VQVEGEQLPELRGQRLKLRWLEDSDADALYEIFADEEVTRYWSSPPMRERGEATKLIGDIRELFAEHSLYEWGVASVDDNRVIGTLTFASVDQKNLRAEIGFALRRDSWGRGLMREAIALGLDFAFGKLELTRVEADVDPKNLACLRLLEGMGFAREGYLRERWRVGGVVADSVMLGLLRREWSARSTTGGTDADAEAGG
jgi:RimJ/RimL family protein N-acetyltransferase